MNTLDNINPLDLNKPIRVRGMPNGSVRIVDRQYQGKYILAVVSLGNPNHHQVVYDEQVYVFHSDGKGRDHWLVLENAPREEVVYLTEHDGEFFISKDKDGPFSRIGSAILREGEWAPGTKPSSSEGC